MSKPLALAVLAFVAELSCASAATPPSNPLPVDVLTMVLPGARAEDPAAIRVRNPGWQPAQSAGEDDVEFTGGPASQPTLPRPQRLDRQP